MTLWMSSEVVKKTGVTISNTFKEFIITLLASTRVFLKKSKSIIDFCHI